MYTQGENETLLTSSKPDAQTSKSAVTRTSTTRSGGGKRRYSQRNQRQQQFIPNTHRMTRIRDLFWNEMEPDTETGCHSHAYSSQRKRQLQQYGRFQSLKHPIELVHTSPNVYSIENFLSTKELEYFDQMIQKAQTKNLFEPSFVDGSETGDEQDNTSEEDDEEGTRSSKSLPATAPSKPPKQRNDPQRTSTFLHFTKLASKTIATIETRVADLFQLPHHCIEPLQLIQYKPGQYFKVHHDLGVLTMDPDDDSQVDTGYHSKKESDNCGKKDDNHPIHVALPSRQNALNPPRRLVTVLVYLNDLPRFCCSCTYAPSNEKKEKDNTKIQPVCTNHMYYPDMDWDSSCQLYSVTGGSTKFPLLNQNQGLHVYPKRGRAIVWCNITSDGLPDTRLIHSGEPIHVVPFVTTTRTRNTSIQSEEGNGNNHSKNHGNEDNSMVHETTMMIPNTSPSTVQVRVMATKETHEKENGIPHSSQTRNETRIEESKEVYPQTKHLQQNDIDEIVSSTLRSSMIQDIPDKENQDHLGPEESTRVTTHNNIFPHDSIANTLPSMCVKNNQEAKDKRNISTRAMKDSNEEKVSSSSSAYFSLNIPPIKYAMNIWVCED